MIHTVLPPYLTGRTWAPNLWLLYVYISKKIAEFTDPLVKFGILVYHQLMFCLVRYGGSTVYAINSFTKVNHHHFKPVFGKLTRPN